MENIGLNMSYSYAATFEPNSGNGGFIVTFDDVPEAITEGNDFADAYEMAMDALGVALLGYLEMGKPRPRPVATGIMISPEPDVAAKIAVIETFRQAGISERTLSERIGTSDGETRNILDLDATTRFSILLRALSAMNTAFVMTTEPLEDARP